MTLRISNQEKNFNDIVGWVQGDRALSREEIVTEQALSALKENDHYHLGWGHTARKWSATFFAGCVGFLTPYVVVASVAAGIFFAWSGISAFVASHVLSVTIGAGVSGGVGAFCVYKADVAKYIAKGLIYGVMTLGGWLAYKMGKHVAHSYDKQYADHQAKIAENHRMIVKDLKKSYKETARYLRVRLQEAKKDEANLGELQRMVALIDERRGNLIKFYQRRAGISEPEFMVITRKFRGVMEEVMDAQVETPRSSSTSVEAILSAVESLPVDQLAHVKFGIDRIASERFMVA